MHHLVLPIIITHNSQLKTQLNSGSCRYFMPESFSNVRFRFIKLFVCALIARKVIKTHEKIAIRSRSTTAFKELSRTFSKIIIYFRPSNLHL